MPAESSLERVRASTWWLGFRAGAAFPLALAAGGVYYLTTGAFVGLWFPALLLTVALPSLTAHCLVRAVTDSSESTPDEPQSKTKAVEK